MAASRRCSPSGRSPRVEALVLSCALIGGAASLVTAQAGAPALTLSIKGSATYAQPVTAPLQTALLVVTPAWEDIAAKTPVGGKEASGQIMFLSDLAVVLSNQAMDCTSVFAPRQVTADADFVIIAGRAEAYIAAQGYHTTPIGKVLVDTSGAAASLPIDRFSVDALYTVQKRKSVSKDGLRGNDGRLVLDRTADGWTANVSLHVDELVAEGKIPLKSCGLVTRKKATVAPLLGERRLTSAGDRYGM